MAARSSLQLQVQTSLAEAQARMTKMANQSRHDRSHAVVDKVWLATKSLPLKMGTRKLAVFWAGPFRVFDFIWYLAYRLSLPED